MNKLKNMKILFYIFTFEEKDSKDFKINDLKRKNNFGLDIFFHR